MWNKNLSGFLYWSGPSFPVSNLYYRRKKRLKLSPFSIYQLGLSLPLLVFLVFCAPASPAEKLFHFFCDYWGEPVQEGSQNHPNQSFDRMFSYKQFSDGHYQAQFQIYGDWLPVKSKQGFIYHLEFHPARKSFDLQRFNLKTSVLTLSHIYHLSPTEYQRRLKEKKNNPHLIPYSEKPLAFLDNPAPQGYMSAGFDKSHWQCHKVSGVNYVLKKWGLLVMQILSSG